MLGWNKKDNNEQAKEKMWELNNAKKKVLDGYSTGTSWCKDIHDFLWKNVSNVSGNDVMTELVVSLHQTNWKYFCVLL